MSDSKKKRLSMLDGLTAAGISAPPAKPMVQSNRALRSARDAVDSHKVWEINPWEIEDT
ncbi:MAG: plasmid partitioning protein RepB, partial [Mangrovicoccus sp.]